MHDVYGSPLSNNIRLSHSTTPTDVSPTATIIFHFSVVFAVTLASYYFCFKYLNRVKIVIFQGSDTAKRLSINFLVILEISLELRFLEGVICTFFVDNI